MLKAEAAVLTGVNQPWQIVELDLDNPVTGRYRSEDIDQGLDDMGEGRTIRGLIVHEH